MSKKIESILDKSTNKLLEVQQNLSLLYNDTYAIESEMEKEIEKIAHDLRPSNLRELQKVEKIINDSLLLIVKEINEILFSREMSGRNEADEIKKDSLVQNQNVLELKQAIISRTIQLKKEYKKQPTHSVERNVFQHGLFKASSPNESTLRRIRTDKGIIEEVRNGFRKLYYRNENGYYLTTYDSKVFIGLFKLWEIKGKNGKFDFEFKELLQCIESDLNGGDYIAVGKSLNNLAQTSIIMEEYRDPFSGKKTRTKIHHPIQNAEIIHEQGIARATIEFNNYLHDSLLAGNIVLINMGLFNDLATPTSKNLYLYLVNELPEDQRVIDVDQLIRHIGPEASTRTKGVNMLKDAFSELKDFDVIKEWDVIKEGRFYKSFTYTPSDWLTKNQPLLMKQGNQVNFLSH